MPVSIKLILLSYVMVAILSLIIRFIAAGDPIKYARWMLNKDYPWYMYLLTLLLIIDIPATIYLAIWFLFMR